MTTEPPEDSPRRILVAVTGLSPQVVTETVYALCLRREPAFVPTEVHLLTTREGAHRARLALLSDEPGWFARLLADYALPPMAFDETRIHCIPGADGNPLEDIRDIHDNERAADFICDTVRSLSADPATSLHVSIAGGRKTMGYFLGYALSLFGRTQDRLSHVLVSEPFESSWDFFYPTPYRRVITTRDNKLADTADAQVTLAEIPFVSLRHGLPESLLTGRARFSESVRAARRALGPAELVIDLPTRRVRAAGTTLCLPPAELALLAAIARNTGEGRPPLPAPPKESPDPLWARRYLDELRAIAGPLADLEKTERALREGMDGTYFSSRLSKLRALLRDALGAAAGRNLIEDGGTRPKRYRLALPGHAIRFGPIID